MPEGTKKTQEWIYSQKFSQVFLQPPGVVVYHALSDQKVSGPHAEHHGPVEPSLVVFVRHLHAGGAEPRDVHDAVIPEDVVLAGHHVGFGQRVQVCVWNQQGRRPRVGQRARRCVHPGGRPLPNGRSAVVVFSVVLLRQEGAPVDELEQPGRVGVVVGIGHHGPEEGLVTGEVLAPETHHERAREDGHVPILLVRRSVEVQSLKYGVNERLGLQPDLLFWVFLQLLKRWREQLRR